MRVLIIGGGEVGRNVAQTLSAERHDVTLVDRDERRASALQDDIDAMVVAGNGASPRFLQGLEAGRAELLVAVTQDDAANIIAALAGHQLGARRTVARVRDDDYFEKGESTARDILGIDFAIHPERATAHDLAEAILLPGAVHVEYFGEGRVAVAESIISDRSALAGRPLGERKMVRPHYIAGVVRKGESMVVDADDVLQPGDHVLIAAAREHIGPTVADISGCANVVHHAVVFGGGRIGLPLARRLEHEGIAVTVMERDADRARFVAERLHRSVVLHEEGVSKEAMLAHGVDDADAFVACAGEDRASLLAAMHAKHLGAELCLAVVSRQEFMPMVPALGIDAGFSPRLATAEAILRFAHGENLHAMHLLFAGAEVLEVQPDVGAPIDGRAVNDSGLPPGCQIAAILRNGDVLIPRGKERVLAGDHVLLFGVAGAASRAEHQFDA